MTYTIGDAIAALDSVFPLATQDGWDNSGLLVGDPHAELKGVLFAVDITEEAVSEAVAKGHNLIVAHHPLMFRGLKRLTGRNAEQRIVAAAIRHDITLAAFHTPADKHLRGTSGTIGRAIGLKEIAVLAPERDALCKVVVFVPTSHAEAVVDAMSAAGAGHIGNYSHCAWQTEGDGQFRAEDGAQPYVGQLGTTHHETESRVEIICPRHLAARVMKAATDAHPYEEPAIDITPLANRHQTFGYGVVGNLTKELNAKEFLALLKERIGCDCIRFAGEREAIRRVAICTGSGSELVGDAIGSGADAYVTADMKYHQMSDAAQEIMVADIGHFESESVTKQIFKDIVNEKLPNFAHYETYEGANPIKYY